MSKINVLLVEDEPALAHIVRESLEERDFKVAVCADGLQGLNQFLKQKPDIIVLDVMMPVMDGFELATKIRESDKLTPIIFLTAKAQVKDVITGFETGANDYLKKPFSMEELIIRLKVLLSANRVLVPAQTDIKKEKQLFKIGNLNFDPQRNSLHSGTHTWNLTSRESELLFLICQNNQDTVPRIMLLQKIWGDDNFFNARSLDVFITKLRNHLKADPHVKLINVRGLGYKLVW